MDFYSNTENISKLHLLMAYLMKISSYFLFHEPISILYGIEREQNENAIFIHSQLI